MKRAVVYGLLLITAGAVILAVAIATVVVAIRNGEQQ